MPKDIERNPDGTPKPGQSLRKLTKMMSVRGLSRELRKKLHEKFGEERPYYNWLIDMASNANTSEKVRLSAIQELANRIDGKPMQSIELSGPGGKPLQSETTVTTNALGEPDRIAGVLRALAGAGALAPGAEAGGTGSSPHPEVEQVPSKAAR
jgi:hypothetical protein